MKTLCRKLKLPEDFDYQQLARLTPGYVGADLMALCREAAMSAVNRVLLKIRKLPQTQKKIQTEAALGEEQPVTDINPVVQEQLGQSHLQVGDRFTKNTDSAIMAVLALLI